VREVRSELVFAVAFDGISPSRRHKCGLTVRSARIGAWRRGVSARAADTLETLHGMLTAAGRIDAPVAAASLAPPGRDKRH
jgi:DNA ligase-1